MSVYAFIFARGGSKGLPRKNVKLLAGKPLIEYSIDVAQQTPGIDRVFVSTDDSEIASVAMLAGATVIHRPEELATDTSPEWLAWRHAIEYVVAHYGDFDLFVSLPPTSPLRSIQDVAGAIDLFNTKRPDVCLSVTPASRSPFFNMVKRNKEGYCELVNAPLTPLSRRQDAPQVFDITTVVYVTTPLYVMTKGGLFDGQVVCVEVPKARAIDIDDEYDFMLAEVIKSTHGVTHVEG